MLGHYWITGSSATDIAASVEHAVASGTLEPGAPLPTVRALAGELGVNPNTVGAAYRSLRDRGVVETAGRHGTRVRQRSVATPRAARLVEVPSGVRDVSTGNPAVDLLPPLERALRSGPARPALYDDDDIAEPLARAARERFDGIRIEASHLAVTFGALDAIERVLSACLRPGDAVAVEDPGWGNLLDLVAALGLRVEPVPVDDDGPTVEGAERALSRGARALVLTCRAQNPTGAALSPGRARALRRVLRSRPGVLLVEDDHGAEVAGVAAAPASAAPAPTQRWVHIRSMSKSYGPDLRVAVLTGDADTVTRVRGRLRIGAGWVSHLLQHAAATLWDDPRANARVTKARERYAARRTALVERLAANGVAAHARSGLNVWVPVADETAAITSLLADGWAAAPGARFRIAAPPAVRITVADLSAGDVAPLAEAVARAAIPPMRSSV